MSRSASMEAKTGHDGMNAGWPQGTVSVAPIKADKQTEEQVRQKTTDAGVGPDSKKTGRVNTNSHTPPAPGGTDSRETSSIKGGTQPCPGVTRGGGKTGQNMQKAQAKPSIKEMQQKLASLQKQLDECQDYRTRVKLRSQLTDLHNTKPVEEVSVSKPGSRKVLERTPSGSQQVMNVEHSYDLENGQQKVSVTMKTRRTPSNAELYEKTTKVQTVIPDHKEGRLEETDTIVTKTKLTKRGSEYFNMEAVANKHLRTKSGSEYEETDVLLEKEEVSVSQGTHTKGRTETKVCSQRPPETMGVPSTHSTDELLHQGKTEHKAAPARKVQSFRFPSEMNKSQSVDVISKVLKLKRGGSMNRPLLVSVQEERKDTQGLKGQEGLSIVEPLRPLEVLDGQPATLSFRVHVPSGSKVKVNWYLGSSKLENTAELQQIFDGSLVKLRIAEVFPDDEGMYRCVVSTGNEEVETFAKLVVRENKSLQPPSFRQELADVSATEGEDVTFRCVVCGNPTPTVTWYKADQQLKNSTDFHQTLTDGIASMSLPEVFAEDTAEYSCVAKNSAGVTSSSCYLTVTELPTSPSKSPRNSNIPSTAANLPVAMATDNQDVSIATSDAQVACRPIIQGKQIDTRTGYRSDTHISVTKLKSPQVTVTLAAKPEGESQENGVTVTPLSKPAQEDFSLRKIEGQLTDNNLITKLEPPQETITSAAEVEGESQEKGVTVTPLSQPNKEVTSSGKTDDQLSDNGVTFTTSTETENKAEETEPEKESPRTTEPSAEERFTSIVEFPGSSGSDFKTADKSLHVSHKTLLPSTSSSDNHDATHTKQGSGEAVIETAPAFTVLPQNVSVHQGQRAAFQCQVEASPLPSFMWYKNGQKLEPADALYKQTVDKCGACLVIKEAKDSEVGEYRCVVANSVGQVSAAAMLQVLDASPAPGKPSFPHPLADLTVDEGATALLQCEVDLGESPQREAKVTWVRHGKPVTTCSYFTCSFEGRKASLQVQEIYPQDKGLWECVVLTPGGEARTSCNLTVRAKQREKAREAEDVPEVPDSLIESLLAGKGVPDEEEKPDAKTAAKVRKSVSMRVGPSEPRPRVGKVASLREKFVNGAGSGETRSKMADLSGINDEEVLHKMLQKTEDFNERRRIRGRLKEIREAHDKAYAEKKAVYGTEDAVQLRLRQAEAEKTRKMKQFEKDQELHIQHAKKPDVVEEHTKQRLAAAEAERQKKLEDARKMSTVMSAGYGVRSQDIAPVGAVALKTEKVQTEKDKMGSTVQTVTKTTTVIGEGGEKVERKQVKSVGGTQYGASKAAAGKQNARSAMNQFKQMDTAAGGGAKPSFAVGRGGGRGVGVQRSPSAIKEMLLNWTKAMTREYADTIEIKNFSSSWNDGMAFCALIHHFYPDAFDFGALNPKQRRRNFQLAFDTAEKEADIAPLLDVEDMVRMKNPDWKCVFTYVQSLYRGLHKHERNQPAAPASQ